MTRYLGFDTNTTRWYLRRNLPKYPWWKIFCLCPKQS